MQHRPSWPQGLRVKHSLGTLPGTEEAQSMKEEKTRSSNSAIAVPVGSGWSEGVAETVKSRDHLGLTDRGSSHSLEFFL